MLGGFPRHAAWAHRAARVASQSSAARTRSHATSRIPLLRLAPTLPRALRPLLFSLLLTLPQVLSAQPAFVAFESGHVRPIALSPAGDRLFVVNTPDNTLEIFDVSAAGLTYSASVPVGMEPV